MSNYAIKTYLKEATGVDTSSFAKKIDLAHLTFDVDKLDFDKLKIVPTNLSNLKSKIDKLDLDKLVSIPVDLSKLSNVVKNDDVKKIYIMLRLKIIKIKYLILLIYLVMSLLMLK